MSSSSTRWISENKLFVTICMVILSTTTFFLAIGSRSAEFQALDRQVEEEVAQESRMACEKWGMKATTSAYVACIADLATIRANHDNRRRANDFGL